MDRLRRLDGPLARFVVAGIVVFALDRAFSPRADTRPRIVVTDAFVDGLRSREAARGGLAPSDDALVRDFVRDEVLFREAIARGLLDGDPIARRRLVQAAELVLAAEADVPAPTEAELEAYLAAHADTLRAPARSTVEHVFFARSDDAAARAAAALEALSAGASSTALGDPFLSGRSVGPATDARLDATFGIGFAARIAALDEGTWAGPIEGTLGLHLVRVTAREPSAVPPLDDVRSVVTAACEDEARAAAVERAVDALVAEVDVVREDG